MGSVMNYYENDDCCNDDVFFSDQVECFLCKLSDLVQQVWLVGLGVLGCVQVEGSCFFDGLVKEGEVWEVCCCECNGDQGLGWCDNVEILLDEVCEKVFGIWNKVEKVFDDQVQGVFKCLYVFIVDEVIVLEVCIDVLYVCLVKLENCVVFGVDVFVLGSYQLLDSVF